ncbi:MAG: NAD(P)/FAD-dependent oxidoreductase [Gammaproteobacteria bacterium]|nr:NAD(P)/FAD-dependent oxidoreductase [Gammaproteobacteria bacterium]
MAERIIISGAGLAGSLLAVMLARRGMHVTVYEKRSDMRKIEQSAGRSINLALADRGIAALAHAGVMDQVRPLMLPMPGRMLHDKEGKLQFQRYSINPDEINYSVSRGELNKALMDAAEATGKVTLKFEHEIVDVDFDARSLAVRDLQANELITEDNCRVIAADGAGSPVRHAMEKKLGIDSHTDMLDHAYKELSIPPADDGGFRIDAEALHIWPRGGYMVIALPNLDGSFTVTLFLASEGETSFASIDTPETVESFFKQEFADLHPLLPDLQEEYFGNPTGSLGTVRCQPWHVEDFAVLLGDAAHAIVPFHGQGMNCAFEDCLQLDQLIESQGGDWSAIFPAFSELRKPNADAIADMALDNYIEMRDSVRDPRFHLKKQLAFELEKRHPRAFIPRYSMVMFHPEIAYADAQARGKRQSDFLDRHIAGCNALEDVDFPAVEAELDSLHG